MNFTKTDLEGSYIINPTSVKDNRGWFMRTYSKDIFENSTGIATEFVQCNQSFTATRGTVRGMHLQKAPAAEIKIVRCISGSIYDVIVDLRKNSPTFLKWFGAELSAANKKMLYIPEGFAHGFQTLEHDTELIYMHSAFYNPEFEMGLKYNDPLLKIKWPMGVTEVSAKDQKHLMIEEHFTGY